MDEEQLMDKNQWVMAALPHIAFDGWTKEALYHAAHDMDDGLSQQSITQQMDREFPHLPKDLLSAFASIVEQDLQEHIAVLLPKNMRFHEKLTGALMASYQHFAPYRPAMQKAAGLGLNPSMTALGLTIIARQADSIWSSFQDQSLDFNYYSKRASLSMVLLSSLQIYLYDDSENLQNTRAFLMRRIDDVMRIPKIKAQCQKRIGAIKDRFCHAFAQTMPNMGIKSDLKMRGR